MIYRELSRILASNAIEELGIDANFFALTAAQKLQVINSVQQETCDDYNKKKMSNYLVNTSLGSIGSDNSIVDGSTVLDANGSAVVLCTGATTKEKIFLNTTAGNSGLPIRITSVTPGESFTITSEGYENDAGLEIGWIVLVAGGGTVINGIATLDANGEATIASADVTTKEKIHLNTTAGNSGLPIRITSVTTGVGFTLASEGYENDAGLEIGWLTL